MTVRDLKRRQKAKHDCTYSIFIYGNSAIYDDQIHEDLV